MIQRNLLALARELKLTDTELEVLTFLVATQLNGDLLRFVENTDYSPAERHMLVAAATGLSTDEVMSLLSDGATLISSGLVEMHPRYHGRSAYAVIVDPLVEALTRLYEEPGDVLAWAISRDRQAALPIEAFAHLKPWQEVAWRCLKAADLQGRGLNVLLHGLGGAGKTALARCLARTARLDLFLPPQNGPAPRWSDTEFARAFTVLRRRGHGVLLVDPGFFSLGREPGLGQLHFLHLLDHPGVQVLWTASSLDEIHPNLRHRFDLVLALPAPTEPWTRPVWEDLLTPDERMKLEMGLP